MPTARIHEIDGLRAIAMTMVIAQHCGLMPFGWTGVWLFFVISGYVITRNFLGGQYENAHTGGQTGVHVNGSAAGQYGLFMAKRFFRIVPVYVFYLAINAITLVIVEKTVYFRDFPFLLSFTYNWQMVFQFWPTPQEWSPTGHLWTLSVEEQFYVFYPLLFLFLPRRHYLTALGVLAVAGPLIRLGYSSLLAAANPDRQWIAFAVYEASFAQFDAFLIGALVANGEPYVRRRPWIAHALAVAAAGFAACYILVYAGMNFREGARGVDVLRGIISGVLYGGGREVFVYSVVSLLAAAALLYAILRKPFLRFLAHPWIVLAGRVSYGGYLYHAFILFLFVRTLIPLVGWPFPLEWRIPLFLATWSATFLAAYASFRWFEKPIMDWAARRERRPSHSETYPVQVPATSATSQ